MIRAAISSTTDTQIWFGHTADKHSLTVLASPIYGQLPGTTLHRGREVPSTYQRFLPYFLSRSCGVGVGSRLERGRHDEQTPG